MNFPNPRVIVDAVPTKLSPLIRWLQVARKLARKGDMSCTEAAALSRLERELDSVGQFVSDMVSPGSSDVTLHEMFAVYKAYCAQKRWVNHPKDRFERWIAGVVREAYGKRIQQSAVVVRNGQKCKGFRRVVIKSHFELSRSPSPAVSDANNSEEQPSQNG